MRIVTLFIFIISFFFNTNGSAQNYFGLSKLIEFANTSRLSQFDKNIRSFNYIFKETSKEENHTRYNYQKKYSIGGYAYTNSISYLDYADGRPVIVFASAFNDFYLSIKAQIENNGFKETNMSSEENMLVFSYESANYNLMLYTISKETDDEENYNSITVKIWKKAKR